MCAIFGTIGKADLDLIKQISKTQIYRGPDEQNFYESKDKLVSLGNNRLSVIDIEKGKQPMFSANKRFVTVFNGCIYNFKEIRNFLKSKKVSFETNSDTEVVANCFQYFGNKTFNYFDGMWAIAIYDLENQEVTLSRDYVGQKPLYYSKVKSHYVFSSELNGILVDKDVPLKISKNNLRKYFAYSHIPAPHTIFESISQLEPGENIIINANNIESKKIKYWEFKKGSDYNLFFNKLDKKDFKSGFQNIIEEHSVSDKNPSISLSGGIDSFMIMKYLKKINRKFISFTLGFENKSYDESSFVKKIISDHKKEIFIAKESDLKSNFIELSKLIHDPIGDSSILPTYIIHKEISKNSNVTLGGDGGDESFFGYITFDAFYLALKIKKIFPNFILKIINKLILKQKETKKYLTFKVKLKKFFESIDLKQEYLLPSWMSCLSNKDLNNLLNQTSSVQKTFSESDEIFNNTSNLMRNCQLYHFKYYLPMILSKIDQASMFNSVESRSPFLSKKIINFSLDQDISFLYKAFNKKYFLKKIFKSLIPSEILNRKKHGFAFPKEKILADKELIEKLIDTTILVNINFFNEKYENFLNKKEDCSQYLWNELILNLSLQNLRSTRYF